MNGDTKYYEISYLLGPSLSENDVHVAEDSVRELLGSINATVESWDSPKRRYLSYEIAGTREVYAGAIRFMAAPKDIIGVKESLRTKPEIIRFMALEWKKAPPRRAPRLHKPPQKEEHVPTDEKALDEKLEEILAKNI